MVYFKKISLAVLLASTVCGNSAFGMEGEDLVGRYNLHQAAIRTLTEHLETGVRQLSRLAPLKSQKDEEKKRELEGRLKETCEMKKNVQESLAKTLTAMALMEMIQEQERIQE